jgi:hypothetical protein
LEEAKQIRLELMEERKQADMDIEACLPRDISFCEH